MTRTETAKALENILETEGNGVFTDWSSIMVSKGILRVCLCALKEEPIKGRWNKHNEAFKKCSVCGHKTTNFTDFCPGCGAYMKGAK